MTDAPPKIVLPPELAAAIERTAGLRKRVDAFLADAPRPCVYLASRRVAHEPQRRGLLGRLLGLGTAPPQLGALVSKFGGGPYVEETDLSWRGFVFLGQVNLSTVGAGIDGTPRSGILAVDQGQGVGHANGFRVRWYPEPSEARAVACVAPCRGYWETQLEARAGWSLPLGARWSQVVGDQDRARWDLWTEFEPEGYSEDTRDEAHRVFGHRPQGLDEHYELHDHELVWRITYDNEADFGWGTNWLNVMLHRDDLASGRLDRCVVLWSNA